MFRISNSEIETWQRCRRQHWWEYVQRLQPKASPSPLRAAEIGTAFHAASEMYYGGMSGGDVTAHLQEIVDIHETTAPEGEQHKAADLVLTMWEGYLDWLAEEGIDQGINIIGPETTHTRKMSEFPDVEFIGKIDIETEEDIIDQKTTKLAFAQKIKVLRRSRQLIHYAWLIAPTRHINRVRVRVTKQSTRSERTSGPYYVEEKIPVTRGRLRSHEEHLRDIVPGMLANYARETLPAPSPNSDCSWICPLYLVCDMADQGEDYQYVIDNEFVQGNPLERYEKEGEE